MTDAFRKPFAAPPTIFLVSLAVGSVLWLVVPWGLGLPLSMRLSMGTLAVIVGVVLIRGSMREIAAGDTTYDPFDHTTNLVDTGVYRYSRNPGYLGLAILQLAIAILFDSGWIIVTGLVAAAITSVFVIRLEEEKLSARFGAKYDAYRGRVRRWI